MPTPVTPPARRRPRPRPRGYTVVELFLTVAVLMMVLGLVVNLANRERSDALDRRTRRQLQRLAVAVGRYAAAHGGALPAVTPLVDPDPTAELSERAVHSAAVLNADAVRRALGWPPPADPSTDPLADPWGTPIAFMPRQSPLIGMAPGDRFFFVSAGPDRQFLTRADNVYSYDDPAAPTPPSTDPATRPASGGHDE